MTAPMAFISYSWSSREHEAWVLKLAEELVENGVHIIIDKWDLGKGHDANAFMEQMASREDIKKVIMICDKTYQEKADARKGGAGTEAQIISPQIYQTQDQNKFLAVLSEKDQDGNAYLPVFYKGRIWIDLSDSTNYGSQFEELVRWAFDKPMHVRPQLGKPPAYITKTDATLQLATSTHQRRAVESLRSGRSNSAIILDEYLDKLADEMGKLRLQGSGKKDFDIEVMTSIDEFIPYRDQYFEAITNAMKFGSPMENLSKIHRFFEKIIKYTYPDYSKGGWSEWDFDNLRFISYELYLGVIAIAIRHEEFAFAANFVSEKFYVGDIQDLSSMSMMDYTVFIHSLPSFEAANRRTEQRRITKVGDVLHERAKHTYFEFRHLGVADLILHIRSRVATEGFHQWYAVTPIYMGRSQSAIETFARCRSLRYFERMKPLLGVSSAQEFRERVAEIDANRQNTIPMGFRGDISIASLTGADRIATEA